MQRLEDAASIPSARPAMSVWSTAAIREGERFSYWREAICQTVFNISIEASAEDFSARMAARSSGALRFAISQSTPYKLVRSQRDIERAPADHYSIYMQISGQTVASVDDTTVSLYRDDIAIYDGTQSFSALHGGQRAIAVVPSAMIDQRAPWMRHSPPRKLAANSPYIDLARRHLMELSREDATLSDNAAALLTENLCNLMALASAGDIEPRRLQPELQIEAMLAFCRQNLHDAELSPQVAADRLGISVRSLHARFKYIGQTFGRWLLENRLEACASALRDRNQRALNISEIAYHWGFNDLSHFNKVFRNRFDRTPREWRNEP
jgi:AraC family transcriptional activator of tynA and feaB